MSVRTTRVHLLRRATRQTPASRRQPTLSRIDVEMEWHYWVHVLGVYRDARREGASQTTARALIYFTLAGSVGLVDGPLVQLGLLKRASK